MKYSGESNLKTIGLEMGGKSPFIVLEDAKITDDLIDNAINSAFWNGGQNCSANMRQIIHSKVKDEFLDKVSKKVKALKVGDPLRSRKFKYGFNDFKKTFSNGRWLYPKRD